MVRWATVLGILLLAARLVNVRADLPYLVSYTDAPIDQTDEGFWTRNARLFVRTGSWHDGTTFNPMAQAPVYSYALAALFGVVGVGWLQARLLSVAASMAACVAAAVTVHRSMGPRAALTVAVLFGLHPLTFFFSRVATTEMLATAFLVLAMALLAGTRLLTDRTALLAGVLFGAAVATKATAALLLPGAVVYVVRTQSAAWRRKLALAALGTMALGTLLVAAMPDFPQAGQMGRHYIGQKLPASMAQAAEYMWWYWTYSFPIMITLFAPILAFLAAGAVLDMLVAPWSMDRSRRYTSLEVACACWLVTTWVALSLVQRWTRYHLIIVLPTIALALTVGVRAHARRISHSPAARPAFLLGTAFELVFLAVTVLAAFTWRSLEATSIPLTSPYFTTRFVQYWFAVATLGVFVAVTRAVAWRRGRVTTSFVRRLAIILALSYAVVTDGSWLARPEFGTYEAMQNVRRYLPSERHCLAGTVADTLALEIPNPVLSLSYHAMRDSLEHDLLLARPSFLVLNGPAPTAPVRRFCESLQWLDLFRRFCALPVVADLTPSIPPEGMKIQLYRFEPLPGTPP